MWFSIIYASLLSNYTVKCAGFRWFYGEKGGKVYLTVCFFQAKDMETCLLSDTQLSNNEPLILFIIDINTPRLVLYRLFAKLSFTVV